jgi:hypothetical protein
MSRDHHDILIDQLLREILGGDRPRDLTERVMAQARAYDRVRFRWWTGSGAAIAAAIAIAISLYIYWPRNYPTPELDGEVSINNGNELVRGAQIATHDDQAATLKLGGYVNVNLDPQTTLTLGGAKFEEKILLEKGTVNVAVAKKRGTFDVVVGPATVHVTGTQFKAAVEDRDLERENRRVRFLNVAVNEGSVEVLGIGQSGPVTLTTAGTSEKTFELSSEPILVGKPRIERGVPGLQAGVNNGVRLGNRGAARGPLGGFGKGGPATNPYRNDYYPNAAGRGAAGGSAASPLSHFQIIFPNGRLELRGILRREHEIYFLEAEEGGNVLLYPQQSPPATIPNPGTRILVVWDNGKVTRIQPIESKPPSPTTQAF